MVDYREGLDEIFSALSNPSRRQVIELLSLQPASIQQLAKSVDLSPTAITRHISVLEDAGLVERKKSGRTNFLALKRAGIRNFQAWASQFDATWGTDQETLENYVESIRAASSGIKQQQESE